MSTETYEEMMVDLQAPAGFTFNYRAYAECGVVSWRGPQVSTADETLNVEFEWDPTAGTVVTVDAVPNAEYSVDQLRELHASLGAALASLEPAADNAPRLRGSKC